MSDARTKIVIVDDQKEDADSFAQGFQKFDQKYTWSAIRAAEGQESLLATSKGIAAVLLDVDLSGDDDVVGNGLGLAQNIRAEQKSDAPGVSDYPIIRFANRDPVTKFVGDDPLSDDLFDFFIDKKDVAVHGAILVEQVSAVCDLYDALDELRLKTASTFADFCGLDEQKLQSWGDSRLWRKLKAGLSSSSATHVAAGIFLKSFLLPTGLLLDEVVLSYRLGVDMDKSKDWPALKAKLDFSKYVGVASSGFERWWSRGVDTFWADLDQDEFLHELGSEIRTGIIKDKLDLDIVPIEPNKMYWRRCALTQSKLAKDAPLAPKESINLIEISARDPWLDPEQAKLDVALMYKDDARIDADSLPGAE